MEIKTMEEDGEQKQRAVFTKVTFSNGTKKAVKVPTKPFTIKLRAEFHTPKGARA